MATLTITFAGICTHFYNVVPGVPMRTVLPDASAVRFGALNIDANDPVSYLLMPHVPLLIDVNNVTGNKVTVIAGAGLKIVNAAAVGNSRPTRPDGGFSLTDYVQNFAYSQDVVLNGGAAGYFDISLAQSVTTVVTGNGTRTTVVKIETIGDPQLEITPFPGSLMADTLLSTSTNLFVTNNDYDPLVADINFDFVLNYLVARGGIPKQLTAPTPGTPPNPTLLTPTNLGNLFQSLGAYILAGGALTIEQLLSHANNPVSLNESCSDSHYP